MLPDRSSSCPAISEDNACGYGGFFATIDDDPVFVQEHYDFLPGMSARCDVLHKAAIDLVKAAVQNPSALYEDSMKRLTPDEQMRYEALRQTTNGNAGSESAPDTVSDDSIPMSGQCRHWNCRQLAAVGVSL